MSEQAERLFEQALTLEGEARAAFVDDACQGLPRLREEVIALLDDAGDADRFFDRLHEAVFSSSASNYEGDDIDSLPQSEFHEGDKVRQYHIVSLVGRSGMGTVFRARDTRLNRDVALKFLPSHLGADPDDQARLLVEARAAAALDHTNVCSIYEIGDTDDGRLFITMPYYSGETLKDRLRRGRLQVQESVTIAAQIARGLTAAQSRGVVHRDVKPGNVMLLSDGTVRLLDFGLAMATNATLVSSGITQGTIAYMSPEQVHGDPLDSRTDLWSLGVVLYEMLAGVRPFNGENHRGTIQAILHEEAVPIRERRQDVAPALAAIVDRLLQKDRAERYGSAAEVAAALEHQLPSASHTAHRAFFTKHRALLAGSSLALLVLTGVLSWRSLRNVTASESKATRVQRSLTQNLAAYELYVRGSDPVLLRSDSGARQRLDYFRRAVALDSQFAAAYAGLAKSYVRLRINDAADTQLSELDALAEKAGLKALALDDSLAEAHYAYGITRESARDYAATELHFKRAIALDPANPDRHAALAGLYLITGRPAGALVESQRALDLGPLSPSANVQLARALLANGRFNEALQRLDKFKAVKPPLLRVAPNAAQCYALQARWNEALRVLSPQAEHDLLTRALYGYVLARAGHRNEALRIHTALMDRWRQRKTGAAYVGMVYAGMGMLEQSFLWLNRGVDDGSLVPTHVNGMILEPVFKELHSDPRFASLKERLGLPPAH